MNMSHGMQENPKTIWYRCDVIKHFIIIHDTTKEIDAIKMLEQYAFPIFQQERKKIETSYPFRFPY